MSSTHLFGNRMLLACGDANVGIPTFLTIAYNEIHVCEA